MMKLKGIAATLFAAVCLLGLTPHLTFAAFVSGSTGADGAFEPTASIALQIPESGVFNFTTVNIPSGVTVTFRKNTLNTPVTILATGDVTISGSINVNGINAVNSVPGTGGPGGFDGGIGGYVGTQGFRGQGPGGGGGGIVIGFAGSGGGGGFSGSGGVGSLSATHYSGGCCYNGKSSGNGTGGSAYGNAGLTPLIGGSGGGGATNTTSSGSGGGGGGGAILIASSGTIRIDGALTANGGNGFYGASMDVFFNGGGGGSGGAIRLAANVITGEGTISANGGTSPQNPSTGYTYKGGAGSAGRIRLEAWQITRASSTSPAYAPYLYPVAVYPTSVPALEISQINGIQVPNSPSGVFKSPDVTLPYNSTGPVTITVSATNIPVGTTVTVTALPETGNSTVTATETLGGTLENSSAQVSLETVKGMAYLLSASVNY